MVDAQTRPDQTAFMNFINIQEAKTHLSRLVEDALNGADIVIAKAGKPLVRLVPVTKVSGVRPLGLLAGQITEAPDCWEPDAEFESLFYGDEVKEASRVAEPQL